MDRRRFIQNLILFVGGALIPRPSLSGYLPQEIAKAAVEHFTSGNPTATVFHSSAHKEPPPLDLTLRELTQRKLHHGRGRFINPFLLDDRGRGNPAQPPVRRHGSLWRLLYWKLIAKNHFSHLYKYERVKPVVIDWERIKGASGLSITFIRHATVLIKDSGRYILVDPVFFGLFPFIKDFSPLRDGISSMPQPHHILITHGHYDHLDGKSLTLLAPSPHVIAPLGYEDLLHKFGMKRTTSLDWFETYEQGRLRITLLPCHHWTMRNPFEGANTALWGSFLIQTATGRCIFVSGDTAYFSGFRELGQEFSIDLAIFNLGAYEPRWFMKHSHLNPQEVVKAFTDLKAKHLMVVHWGTFRLVDEPVYHPPLELKREMKRRDLLHRLIQPRHGETIYL